MGDSVPVFTVLLQQSSLASALAHPIELKPVILPNASAAAYPSLVPPMSVTHPTPQYGWGDSDATASSQTRATNSYSPASSERSVRSTRSVHTPLHMSPSLSSASTSSQESPMLLTSTPPLWDNGEPYKPAPILPIEGAQGPPPIGLAPLETLPRSHTYRRCAVDDHALRLLTPGAH